MLATKCKFKSINSKTCVVETDVTKWEMDGNYNNNYSFNNSTYALEFHSKTENSYNVPES